MSSGKDSIENIATPEDEFQYWADCAVTGTQLTLRSAVPHVSPCAHLSSERAQFFQEQFNTISNDFANVLSLSLADILELVEKTQVQCVAPPICTSSHTVDRA